MWEKLYAFGIMRIAFETYLTFLTLVSGVVLT